MSDFSTVVVAIVTVVVGGYLKDFVAEDFRRFRDGQALAGALAGELKSHRKGMDELRPALDKMLVLVQGDMPLLLPEIEKPVSPIFEANVQRIGLLGPKLAEQVAAVYEQINGFRVALVRTSQHHSTMPKVWRETMIVLCTKRLDTALEIGTGLVTALDVFSSANYWDRYRRLWSVYEPHRER